MYIYKCGNVVTRSKNQKYNKEPSKKERREWEKVNIPKMTNDNNVVYALCSNITRHMRKYEHWEIEKNEMCMCVLCVPVVYTNLLYSAEN